MLPNELFALACRAYYDEEGIVVDKTNGQFAHCPQPERYGNKGYYLTWEDHQQQGLLQSRDIGECCFFVGHARKWLVECDYFPENYFELWDIYEKYVNLNASNAAKKLHGEKDENGKSIFAVKTFAATLEKYPDLQSEAGKKAHEEKDENGKSKHSSRLHENKDELGRSLIALKMNEKVHADKTEDGKSSHAVKAGSSRSEAKKKGAKKFHEKKDEKGRSVGAVKNGQSTTSQVWESTVDGYRSNVLAVARHNKLRGWDPAARVRIS
jgi:hypothetical protein